MGYFTWTNTITTGSVIKDSLFSEVLTKYNTVRNSHCPANYTANYGGHYNGHNTATHSNRSACSNLSHNGSNERSNYYVCSRGTRYS